jgi:hypothetical protein
MHAGISEHSGQAQLVVAEHSPEAVSPFGLGGAKSAHVYSHFGR